MCLLHLAAGYGNGMSLYICITDCCCALKAQPNHPLWPALTETDNAVCASTGLCWHRHLHTQGAQRLFTLGLPSWNSCNVSILLDCGLVHLDHALASDD